MGIRGLIVVRYAREPDPEEVPCMAGRIKKVFFIRHDAGELVETLYTTQRSKWPRFIRRLLKEGRIEEDHNLSERPASALWPFIEYQISADEAADGTIVYVDHPTEVVLDLKKGEVAPATLPLHPRVRQVRTPRPRPKKRRIAAAAALHPPAAVLTVTLSKATNLA